MNTALKIGIILLIVVIGVLSYSNYIKPKANKASKLPLAYDNSKINPAFKTALGL